MNEGCQQKRQSKAASKNASSIGMVESVSLLKANEGITENATASPTSSLGKRARPVLNNEFNDYHAKTQKKITEIKKKIESTSDKKEKKRLKNMISAYASRLHKREDIEQLKEQVSIRNKQIQIMVKVL